MPSIFSGTDTLGRLISTTPPIPTGATAGSVTTTNTYDALGHLTQVSAPRGRTTTYTYDANGNKLTETLNNHTTQYQYDGLNRLIVVTNADNTKTQYAYDFRNNVADNVVLDATGHTVRATHNAYDPAGRLISVTAAYNMPGPATTNYTYYDDGRKKTEFDPAGNTTLYTYDQAGRLSISCAPVGNRRAGCHPAPQKRISNSDATALLTGGDCDRDTVHYPVSAVFLDDREIAGRGTPNCRSHQNQIYFTYKFQQLTVRTQSNSTIRPVTL